MTHTIRYSINGRNGTTFARGWKIGEKVGDHRVFISDCKGWDDLNKVQKKALCTLLWAVEEGVFEVIHVDEGYDIPKDTYTLVPG